MLKKRIPKGQLKLDTPEKLAIQATHTKKNTTQYGQTNTNNVTKTWALLQITEVKRKTSLRPDFVFTIDRSSVYTSLINKDFLHWDFI